MAVAVQRREQVSVRSSLEHVTLLSLSESSPATPLRFYFHCSRTNDDDVAVGQVDQWDACVVVYEAY